MIRSGKEPLHDHGDREAGGRGGDLNVRWPATLSHLKRLLAIPDEQPALLCAAKRLALVKAMHTRLGAGSAAAFATHDVLQKITCESGRRSELETHAEVLNWQTPEPFAAAAPEDLLIPQFSFGSAAPPPTTASFGLGGAAAVTVMPTLTFGKPPSTQ